VIVHAWLTPQLDGKLGERMQFGELGSTAQEAEETVKEVSCASAMLTMMTRKMIRASRGTDPTLQRRHVSGVTNAYAMFCSEGHPTHRSAPDAGHHRDFVPIVLRAETTRTAAYPPKKIPQTGNYE